MRIVAATAFAVSLGFAAQAAEITIDMPDEVEIERTDAAYQCGEFELAVQYINAGSVSLAVFTVEDETVVASNVIAASGAKYAGGRYVLWSQGSDADLYDLMKGEDAEPVSCSEKS
ncbi:membrane-bound inhibitor of C-type lysozyme [Mesorhizobium sp. J18]|nr:membrane-bound inhibitor of C-type lysozyme [Mesorhizobium sp. J18]